jgi:hypothetical protein
MKTLFKKIYGTNIAPPLEELKKACILFKNKKIITNFKIMIK